MDPHKKEMLRSFINNDMEYLFSSTKPPIGSDLILAQLMDDLIELKELRPELYYQISHSGRRENYRSLASECPGKYGRLCFHLWKLYRFYHSCDLEDIKKVLPNVQLIDNLKNLCKERNCSPLLPENLIKEKVNTVSSFSEYVGEWNKMHIVPLLTQMYQ